MAALALSVCVGTASADTAADAWNAAKNAVPAKPYVIVGMNVATVKTSQIFQQLYPMALQQAGGAKDGLDTVKVQCGIDVVDSIQGFVVIADESSKGIFYIATKGIDQKKIGDCLSKIAAKEKKAQKLSMSGPDGNGIVEFSFSGEAKKLYIAFKGSGVLAMAMDPMDKATLVKWLTPGKAGDPAAAALAKVNTNMALWAVVVKHQELNPGQVMKVAYGGADLAGGNMTGELHMVFESAKQASDAATKSNADLDAAKKSGQVPPQLSSVMKSVKIAASGDELTVKASISEKEILGLLGMFMGGVR